MKKSGLREKLAESSGGPTRYLSVKEPTARLQFLRELDDGDGWAYLDRVFDAEAGFSRFYYPGDAPGKDVSTAYFAVAVDGDGDAAVWELRKTVLAKLEEYDAEYGSVTDRPYKISRTGEGKKGTKYTCVPLDRSDGVKKKARAELAATVDLHDVIESLVADDD